MSEYVKDLRAKSGLTANEFAKLHNISHSQIAKYESGALDSPSLLVIAKFCKNFNMDSVDFADQIICDNPGLDDVVSFTTSIDHLINSDYDLQTEKYIRSFFEYAKNKHSLNRLFYNHLKLKTVDCPYNAEATCEDKVEDIVVLNYVPYKKIQKNGSAFDYYHDFTRKLGLVFMYKVDIVNKYIFITPSLDAYNAFTEREYRKLDDMNIIIYYYKYRREPQYKVICGKDFLI